MSSRLILAATLLLAFAVSAQEAEPVADALKELKAGPPTAESLARTVPLLADPAARNSLRNAILNLDPFPSKDLVTLLSDPSLAVRLGALELLEEKAGGDFAYNPWSPPGAPRRPPGCRGGRARRRRRCGRRHGCRRRGRPGRPTARRRGHASSASRW